MKFQKPKMKFIFTRRCLAIFFLLCNPTPTLPVSSNLTYPVIEPEPYLYVVGRKKLMDAQYKCYDRMEQLPPYEGEGPYCNRTWDGWMCWDDTPAGVLSVQLCPDYFPDFDPTEKVTKYCDEKGVWFKHPENNRTWSNYTLCNAFTPEKLQNAYVLYYLAIVGHSMSIFTLVISLGIFVFFRFYVRTVTLDSKIYGKYIWNALNTLFPCLLSLGCQRVTLHKHMFLTYILNSMIIIIHLVEVVPNGELVRRDPITCKILHFFHQYMMACNYFWMLCEGIYLHTLIVVAVFTEEQRLRWYYLLGWGFPLIPTTIHAITRALYFNDNCWMSMETHLLYIIHGPVMAALVVNFFFLLNIVRVLVTKMRETHEAESYMYLKAVKATMVLVPLLGIQFVVFPWRPSNKVLGKVYDYFMHSLIHFQGFFVATIYCFCNHEKEKSCPYQDRASIPQFFLAHCSLFQYLLSVQTTLKRQWGQFKIQWNQRWGPRPSNRSAAAARAAAAAAAAAEAGGDNIPVYICHREPRNDPPHHQGEEGTEMIALNIIEHESSA